MARSRRLVVDDTNTWIFRENYSTDPNAGTDGTVDHGNVDYVLYSELGNGDANFTITPALYGDLTNAFRTFVVWSRGVISFGQPTDAQLAFMAAAGAGTDFSQFPGAFIYAGAQDPTSDIFIGLRDPDKTGIQNAYTNISFGDTTILIYADHVEASIKNAPASGIIIDLGTGTRLTDADLEDGIYRLTRLLTVEGTAGNDVITGTAAAQSIYGHDGKDTLTAGTGAADLYGEAGNDILAGGSGRDHLFGGDGSDTISAGRGDLADGGAGNDKITATPSSRVLGGIGTDTLMIDLRTAADPLTFVLTEGANGTLTDIALTYASIEKLGILGSVLNDTLTGNSGANVIDGGAGADIIDGGAGDDVLDAGLGGIAPEATIRTFGGDITKALAIDNAFSAVPGRLPTAEIAIEHSIYSDLNAFFSVNIAADSQLQVFGPGILYDSSGSLVSDFTFEEFINLSGLAAGTYYIEFQIPGLTPPFGAGDTVETDSFSISLSTAAIPNRRNILTGGAGNDTFLVHDATDQVNELASAGNDTVIADLSWTLSDNVENLTLVKGAGAITGKGNGLANTITGNESNNTLFGGDGDDTLIGGAGNDNLRGDVGADRMVGGTGDDIYRVSSKGDVVVEKAGAGSDKVYSTISYTLPDNVETLFLLGPGKLTGTGNALANLIVGDDGANRLDGAGGADTLLGAAGDDTYIVDNTSDRVFETVTTTSSVDAGGIDTVISAVTYSLAATGRQFVENITLSGSGAINAAGNALNNRITGNDAANILSGNGGNDTIEGLGGNDRLFGNDGNDTLQGGAGDDTLNPGSGQDSMTGGAGADVFAFTGKAIAGATSQAKADSIIDFSHAALDRIDLRDIDANANLAGDQAFTFLGTAAFTGQAGELRTEQTTKATWLSGDLNGDGIADFFVRLSPGLTLVAGDFLL